jgi:predicted HicB family RNase H-like nuclease
MTPRTQRITSNLSGGCNFCGNRVRIDVCRIRLYVYDRCPRASESQKAERLNRARGLLLHTDQLADAVEQLARDCSISPRQAYRYLEQAQRLKQPVPPSEAKLAFTVKLPHSLIRRVRTFAAAKGLSISEVVSRALLALLPRGRGRG